VTSADGGPSDRGVVVQARPSWWRVAVGGLAGGVALGLAHGVWWLSSPDPMPPTLEVAPERCPGPGCEFSSLSRSPTAQDVLDAVFSRGLARDAAPCSIPLDAGWDSVTSPDERQTVVDAACLVRGVAQGSARTTWIIGGYRELLEGAWRAELARHRDEIEVRNASAVASWLEGVTEADARRQRAATVTAADLGGLLAWWAVLALWARSRARARAVSADGQGVVVGGEPVPWSRIEAVDWYEGTVEVRLVDGGVRRDANLRLPAERVRAIERACTQLSGH
jgi:hypothetical protein